MPQTKLSEQELFEKVFTKDKLSIDELSARVRKATGFYTKPAIERQIERMVFAGLIKNDGAFWVKR